MSLSVALSDKAKDQSYTKELLTRQLEELRAENADLRTKIDAKDRELNDKDKILKDCYETGQKQEIRIEELQKNLHMRNEQYYSIVESKINGKDPRDESSPLIYQLRFHDLQ